MHNIAIPIIPGEIRNIAKTGYVIIVGRGGVAFANDNPASLHIKLTAPVEWRVERISNVPDKAQFRHQGTRTLRSTKKLSGI